MLEEGTSMIGQPFGSACGGAATGGDTAQQQQQQLPGAAVGSGPASARTLLFSLEERICSVSSLGGSFTLQSDSEEVDTALEIVRVQAACRPGTAAHSQVAAAVSAVRASPRPPNAPDLDPRSLGTALAARLPPGCRVALRRALGQQRRGGGGGGGGGGSAAYLRCRPHTFLVVTVPAARGCCVGGCAAGDCNCCCGSGDGTLPTGPEEEEVLLVDPGFRDTFTAAKTRPWYDTLLASLPHDFVGPPYALTLVCAIMSAAGRLLFRQLGLPLPPWREPGAVLSRWALTGGPEGFEDEDLVPVPLPADVAGGVVSAAVAAGDLEDAAGAAAGSGGAPAAAAFVEPCSLIAAAVAEEGSCGAGRTEKQPARATGWAALRSGPLRRAVTAAVALGTRFGSDAATASRVVNGSGKWGSSSAAINPSVAGDFRQAPAQQAQHPVIVGFPDSNGCGCGTGVSNGLRRISAPPLVEGSSTASASDVTSDGAAAASALGALARSCSAGSSLGGGGSSSRRSCSGSGGGADAHTSLPAVASAAVPLALGAMPRSLSDSFTAALTALCCNPPGSFSAGPPKGASTGVVPLLNHPQSAAAAVMSYTAACGHGHLAAHNLPLPAGPAAAPALFGSGSGGNGGGSSGSGSGSQNLPWPATPEEGQQGGSAAGPSAAAAAPAGPVEDSCAAGSGNHTNCTGGFSGAGAGAGAGAGGPSSGGGQGPQAAGGRFKDLDALLPRMCTVRLTG